jgi:hypothetical protein
LPVEEIVKDSFREAINKNINGKCSVPFTTPKIGQTTELNFFKIHSSLW